MNTQCSDAESEALAGKIRSAANPFDSDKVVHGRDQILDIPDIHHKAYEKLLSELETVRRTGRSRGVLVTGVAGCGKSHLIARLFRNRPEDVLFFQVEQLPAGTGWLKQILQCMVQDLEEPTSPDDDVPQLTLLIRHLIRGTSDELRDGSMRTNVDRLDEALRLRKEEIARIIPDPFVKDILEVLVSIWKWKAPFTGKSKREEMQNKTRLAIQWLKGHMVDDDELVLIGMKRNLGEDELSGQLAYLTSLRVFGLLTEKQAPIVLVFDQIDTFSRATIRSLSKQLLQLIGSDAAARNFLVIVAGVQEELDRLVEERIITPAEADVIFHRRLELPAIGMDECERIATARLAEVFGDQDRALLPHGPAALFPLTREFLRDRFGAVKPSPRRLLVVARAAFEQAQEQVDPDWLRQWPDVRPLTGPAGRSVRPPTQVIHEFLAARLENLRDIVLHTIRSGPVDDEVFAQTIGVLVQTLGRNGPITGAELPGRLGKLLGESCVLFSAISRPSRTLAVAVNNKGAWNSVKSSLKKQKQLLMAAGGPERLVFVRDSRATDCRKWESCKPLLDELVQSARFRLLVLEPADVAFLQALDRLRTDVPDLLIPPAQGRREYQVTMEDFAAFLAQNGEFTKHALWADLKSDREAK